MCSLFSQRMEKDRGDLADIVRASGGGVGSSSGNNQVDQGDWRIPSEPLNFSSGIEAPTDNFGDPFSNMQDPLMYEHDIASTGFFINSNSSGLVNMNIEDDSSLLAQTIFDEEMRRPCNIFSRMLQISPNSRLPISSSAVTTTSPRGTNKTCSLVASNDMVKGNSSTGCSVVDANGGMQISSPRNPGIKRRKSQAKKVVCIPAPAAANSRPSGEIVPSDLWAWRKYGQKPIKGSPYPRGYYRCSSSKGCSARKQVERSRTDPNMLVITYTSEHNHPWPTQRNALAGSTRSQPTKNNAASKSSQSSQTLKPTNLKEEHRESNNDNVSEVVASGLMMMGSSIKEEMANTEKTIKMYDREFHEGFNQNYRPAAVDANQSDDFFADLGELEPDPLNLLFSQGFTGEKSEEERDNKALDPFSLFDWTGNNSFGEAGRGL